MTKAKKWLKRNSICLIFNSFILTSLIILFLTVTPLTVGSYTENTLCEVSPQSSTATLNIIALTETDKLVDTIPNEASVLEVGETTEESRYFDIPLSAELQDYIKQLCDTYGVPYELVIALIDVESSFKPNTVSGTNDYGLMQINVCNHEWLSKELGITDFLDPKQNILSGVFMISSELESANGDIATALMRYNCGAAGAERLQEQGVYSTSYTDKVLTAYDFYKENCRP